MTNYHIVKKYKWSKTVKELCENRCAYCGKPFDGSLNSRIEAHHIKQRSVYPDLECAVENGIALCHVCHLKAHDGCYQAYLDPRVFGSGKQMKKSGPVYEFTQRTFDTALFYPEDDYERLAAAAAAAGESINGYIKKAIEMRMEAEP